MILDKMSYHDDSCDDADSTTTIFSTSSQGSAISITSKNSSEIAKLKTKLDNEPGDVRKEALVLVNSLLEQKENAIGLLEDILKRPPATANIAYNAEAEAPALRLEEAGLVSSKDFFRRVRQKLTKKQFKQFIKNMEELNKLREERARRKYESYMHPLPFSCWPKITIDVGKWQTVDATY